jgi:DNA-binding NarL/FixJ family response regulator
MTTRVVLTDDHQVVREGLRALLAASEGIAVVGEAANGKDAVALAESLAPDVIVMDVTMPGMNGIEAVRLIRQVSPETEVVALSMHASDQMVSEMLRAGAAGYLVKTASVRELANAIKMVMTGRTFLSSELAGLVPAELLRNNSADGGGQTDLTTREREVLKLVAEGRSSREIAIALYVTTKTIVWHRQSIMRKLQLRSVAELTKYAVRMGLTEL